MPPYTNTITVPDKTFRIYWNNGCVSTVVGATISNALEANGYRKETMKLIKDWEVLDEDIRLTLTSH